MATILKWADDPDVKSDAANRDRARLAAAEAAPPEGGRVKRVERDCFAVDGVLWEIRKTSCECCGNFMPIPRRIGNDFIPSVKTFTCPRCFVRRVVGLPGETIAPPALKRPLFPLGPTFVTQGVRQVLAAARDYHGRLAAILAAHATGDWTEGGMGRYEEIADLTPDEAAVAPCLDRGRRNRHSIRTGLGGILTMYLHPRGPDRPAIVAYSRLGGTASVGEATTAILLYGEQPTAAP